MLVVLFGQSKILFLDYFQSEGLNRNLCMWNDDLVVDSVNWQFGLLMYIDLCLLC